MNTTELRKALDWHVSEAKRKGWNIKSGMWVSPKERSCCALGSIAVCNGITNCIDDYPKFLFSILGLHPDDTYSFADGFDGQYYDDSKHDYEFWKLGKEYSKQC